MSFVLLKLIALVLPLRAAADDETSGLDTSLHGEEAYLHSDGSGRSSIPSLAVELGPGRQSVEGYGAASASAHK
jgi:hypothetical protein